MNKASNVATKTIADFEVGKRVPYARTLNDIRAALESAGVEFIAENGGGAGVRLRTAPRENGHAALDGSQVPPDPTTRKNTT